MGNRRFERFVPCRVNLLVAKTVVAVVTDYDVVDELDVERGESLGTIHASSEEEARAAADMLRQCYTFSPDPVEKPPFIKGIIR